MDNYNFCSSKSKENIDRNIENKSSSEKIKIQHEFDDSLSQNEESRKPILLQLQSEFHSTDQIQTQRAKSISYANNPFENPETRGIVDTHANKGPNEFSDLVKLNINIFRTILNLNEYCRNLQSKGKAPFEGPETLSNGFFDLKPEIKKADLNSNDFQHSKKEKMETFNVGRGRNGNGESGSGIVNENEGNLGNRNFVDHFENLKKIEIFTKKKSENGIEIGQFPNLRKSTLNIEKDENPEIVSESKFNVSFSLFNKNCQFKLTKRTNLGRKCRTGKKTNRISFKKRTFVRNLETRRIDQ